MSKEIIKIFVAAAFGAAIVWLLTKPGCGKIPPGRPDTIPATTLQKKIRETAAPLEREIIELRAANEVLEVKSDRLESRDDSLLTQLQQARRIRDRRGEPSAKNTDGAAQPDPCDNKAVDSLTDLAISNKDSIIDNRDSQITNYKKADVKQDSLTHVYKSGFDTATTSLQKWEMYGKGLEKKLKRQRTGVKILKGALIGSLLYIAHDKLK